MAVPGTFTVGQVLTAAEMNALGAMTSFTPTVTGVGTTSKSGYFYKFQNLAFVYFTFVCSGAATAAIVVDYPSGVTPSNLANVAERSNGSFYDNSGTTLYPLYVRTAAAGFRFTYPIVVGATIQAATDLSNTNAPAALAVNDVITGFWIGQVS